MSSNKQHTKKKVMNGSCEPLIVHNSLFASARHNGDESELRNNEFKIEFSDEKALNKIGFFSIILFLKKKKEFFFIPFNFPHPFSAVV